MYEYIGYKGNIKCKTYGKISHSIRFCRFNKCKVYKKEGYIELDCSTKVKTIQVIENLLKKREIIKKLH